MRKSEQYCMNGNMICVQLSKTTMIFIRLAGVYATCASECGRLEEHVHVLAAAYASGGWKDRAIRTVCPVAVFFWVIRTTSMA